MSARPFTRRASLKFRIRSMKNENRLMIWKRNMLSSKSCRQPKRASMGVILLSVLTKQGIFRIVFNRIISMNALGVNSFIQTNNNLRWL